MTSKLKETEQESQEISKPVYDRVVIRSNGLTRTHQRQFFLDIEAAFEDGYRIAKTNLMLDMTMRNLRGRGVAVMYKGAQPVPLGSARAVVVPEVDEDPHNLRESGKEISTGVPENSAIEKERTLLEQLEDLATYKDLKAFAEKQGFELPNKTYNPVAVKKFIKGKLEA